MNYGTGFLLRFAQWGTDLTWFDMARATFPCALQIGMNEANGSCRPINSVCVHTQGLVELSTGIARFILSRNDFLFLCWPDPCLKGSVSVLHGAFEGSLAKYCLLRRMVSQCFRIEGHKVAYPRGNGDWADSHCCSHVGEASWQSIVYCGGWSRDVSGSKDIKVAYPRGNGDWADSRCHSHVGEASNK